MDRLALFGSLFFTVLIATNGSMTSASVMARKGYSPRLGALLGFLTGLAGGMIPALLILNLADGRGPIAVLFSIIGGIAALIALWNLTPDQAQLGNDLPIGDDLRRNIKSRHVRGSIMKGLFIGSIASALLVLAILLWTIIDRSIGLTAVQYAVEPEALTVTAYDTDVALGSIASADMPNFLATNIRPVRLRELLLERIAEADSADWEALKLLPVAEVLPDATVDASVAALPLGELDATQAANILVANLSAADLELLAYTEGGRTMTEHGDAVSVLSSAEVIEVLAESISQEQLQTLVLTRVVAQSEEAAAESDAQTDTETDAVTIPDAPVWQVVKVVDYPTSIAEKPFSMLTAQESAAILVNNMDPADLSDLIKAEVGANLIREERPLVRVLRPLEDLNAEELATLLANNVDAARMQTLVLDMARVQDADRVGIETVPLGQVLQNKSFPDVLTLMPFGQLDPTQAADILMQNTSTEDLFALAEAEVGSGEYEVGRSLHELPVEELTDILAAEVRPARQRVLILELADVPSTDWATLSTEPVSAVLGDLSYPEDIGSLPFNQLTAEQSASILTMNLTSGSTIRDRFYAIIQAEASQRLLEELPETVLATVLAENVSITRLHTLIVDEVLLADNPDWPELVLEPVLSAEQAADILMRNMDRDAFEELVFKETATALIQKRDTAGLVAALANNVRKDYLQELVLTEVVHADVDDRSFSGDLTWMVLKADVFPTEIGLVLFNELSSLQAADLLVRNLPRETVEEIYALDGTHKALQDVSEDGLGSILAMNVRKALLRVSILDRVIGASEDEYASMSSLPIGELFGKKDYPAELAETSFSKISEAQAADLLVRNLNRAELEDILTEYVVQEQIAKGWSLWESLTNRAEIEAYRDNELKRADLKFHSWVNFEFLTSSIDIRRPDATGIRPGLKGSLLVIAITILFAFPIGVGAAIYLEEYATDNFINRIIQTNISNLAGVPSIIYGIIGLAIFVRTLEELTSGQLFGVDTANGRTVLSAGFTLALLILPLIIINAQEAIRAVPNSLRQASYGLGATKWQTIWNHVLPYSMPGILTGTILAISRAIGETAPLILVGGATYLTQDPDGPFSIFTALPLLIYRWTTLPQAEFRNAAAAAIIVLLLLLLTLNSIAVVLRNRFSRRLS